MQIFTGEGARPSISTALSQWQVRPAIWAMLLTALAAYSALYLAERHVRPESQVDEPRYPFTGNGPSLDETFVWIRKWIEGGEVQYTARYQPDLVIQVADRYDRMRHAGCAVALTVADATNETPSHEVLFDLRDIERGIRAVKMRYDGVEIWKVPLQATGLRPLIQGRSGPTNYTSVATTDRVAARRIARAFDHAVLLCSKMSRAEAPLKNEG